MTNPGSEEVTPAVAAELTALKALKKRLEDDPLYPAPAALMLPVWKLWQVTGHLFPNPTPIAALVGVWTREKGLRVDDARDILASFFDPQRMAKFKFASDVITELAEAAATAIRRRRMRQEQEEMLAAQSVPADHRVRLKDFVQDLGRMPES